jgi:hypothetical protein
MDGGLKELTALGEVGVGGTEVKRVFGKFI